MIDDRETVKKVLGTMFPELDTPAPWDLDGLEWAYVWGDEQENGMALEPGYGYVVSMGMGDDVRTFSGVIEALAYVRTCAGVA